MAFLIGTDEAGYGPNLGPLVVGLTAWEIGGDDGDVDLYERLRAVVKNRAKGDDKRIAIADSKQLYRPKGDLGLLERGVFSALSSLKLRPSGFREFCAAVCPQLPSRLDGIPWYQDFDIPLPTTDWQTPNDSESGRWTDMLAEHDVRLVAFRAAVVFPSEFNQAVARYDSKGTVLSETTLDLIAETIESLPKGPVRVVCDKHGGRNKYGALLQPRFGDRLVKVVTEGRQASVYDLDTTQQPIRISFQVGGESFLPSALASMLAKYLRELTMKAFNEFWQRYVEDLRPTAGYPVDAKRFRQQIASAQRRLNVHDQQLWRSR